MVRIHHIHPQRICQEKPFLWICGTWVALLMLNMFRKSKEFTFLGPCVGEVTTNSAKLWIHTPLKEGDTPIEITFSLHENDINSKPIATRTIVLLPENLGAGIAQFKDLKPDTLYFYRIWKKPGLELVVSYLKPEDLHFRTFYSDERPKKIDFLLLSCHDPTQVKDDGMNGYRVWSAIEQIRKENDIRFAIFIGDQIYGDHVQEKVLKSRSPKKRIELYLKTYFDLWSNPHYRRALCSLPSYLMWDDHDITDGWGSRSDSFEDAVSKNFSAEWLDLFKSAQKAFQHMQAIRNPEPLLKGRTFDFCFKVGGAGFAVADLRTNRNSRKHQMWSQEQFDAMVSWVHNNRSDLEVLFFASPVVLSHGWPMFEDKIRKLSPILTSITEVLNHVPILKHFRWAERLIKRNIEDVGGFRDDLEDAWASDPNNSQAEQLLDFLFELQNPKDGSKPLPVIILSGDIHAAGYSMIYSSKPEHSKKPVIEHVCSSPVASEPMNWMLEGMYQQEITAVPVGVSGSYCAQVSHHHCHRNVVVCSVRRYDGEELQLKLKYYLEGRPQPEIIISDLNRISHREYIDWDQSNVAAQQKTKKQAA